MGEVHLDRDLVQKVQKGDKNAFDLLVRKYQHKIIKLISRYVHDPSEALDVSQEAFLKAYRALPGFRGDSEMCIRDRSATVGVTARTRPP